MFKLSFELPCLVLHRKDQPGWTYLSEQPHLDTIVLTRMACHLGPSLRSEPRTPLEDWLSPRLGVAWPYCARRRSVAPLFRTGGSLLCLQAEREGIGIAEVPAFRDVDRRDLLLRQPVPLEPRRRLLVDHRRQLLDALGGDLLSVGFA